MIDLQKKIPMDDLRPMHLVWKDRLFNKRLPNFDSMSNIDKSLAVIHLKRFPHWYCDHQRNICKIRGLLEYMEVGNCTVNDRELRGLR